MQTNLIKRITTTLAIGAGGAHAELKDNKNGTITDTAQGLVWLKDANCFGGRDWYDAQSKGYWSSSSCAGSTTLAWFVWMPVSSVYGGYLGSNYYV